MAISLQTLLELAPYTFAHEGELMRTVKKLHEIFIKREKINEYLKDEKLVSAYLCFYFSTYLPKMKGCIDYLGDDFLESIKESTLIDIGAGPSTLFCALNEYVSDNELIAIEDSLLMQRCGLALADELNLNIKYNKQSSSKDKCLFFSHSLNEMGLSEGLDYVESYRPQQIVFIEPGTKDSFAIMKQMRESLIDKGYHVNYPCQSNEGCPIKEDDWCHQIVKVSQEPEIERLCQKLKMDRRAQPVILHWYSKNKIQGDAIIFRTRRETKFSIEWDLCINNQVKRAQVMKKSLSKKEQKIIAQYKMGQKVKYELIKEVDEFMRIKLI